MISVVCYLDSLEHDGFVINDTPMLIEVLGNEADLLYLLLVSVRCSVVVDFPFVLLV